MSAFSFDITRTSPRSAARRGRLVTRAGLVETPVFMPVGTQATVKTLHPTEVSDVGIQIVLANTYHLMLRPGADVIDEAGGIHRFMGWEGPVLTDSGGFQVFSLGRNARVTEQSVQFQSHIDGSRHELSPEKAIDIQARIGAEMIMPLDHLVALPAKPQKILDACERTHRWLDRSIEAHRTCRHPRTGVLFGICQGGVDREMRLASADYIARSDVSGSAIGGLSVGESKEDMAEILDEVCPVLPEHRPRYLMGVGSPEDMWDCVSRGIDMFDCVLPTRLARNGALLTRTGRIDITSQQYKSDFGMVDPTCDCKTCAEFSAAYLHHLFRSKEILGLRLASIHNLRFMAKLMEEIREAIERDTFDEAHTAFDQSYRPVRRPE